MAGRRFLLAVVLLAAVLHGISITRSLLPAQDGLKFIRIARQFQSDPWPDVVRDTDQHPLYPALIAAVEPLFERFAGPGPDTWRIAAQSVAALASLLLLFPLYRITRTVFDERIACIAVAIYALLPVPAEVGHDTLSDSLGLLFVLLCLRFGAASMRTDDWRPALAAGLAGGVGYLARPEAILCRLLWGSAGCSSECGTWDFRALVASGALPAMGLAALAFVGGYALVKGQVTEKLALRHAAYLGFPADYDPCRPSVASPRLERRQVGTSRPRKNRIYAVLRNPLRAVRSMACEWWDELCWGFAVMALRGGWSRSS